MPELPEVETVARQLEPEIEGHRIERLEVYDERWSRPVAPRELEEAVSGRTIEGLGRRGKYLLLGARRRADAGHAPADDRQPGPGRR